MRLFTIILALICALLGLTLSILPFGLVALIPIILAYIILLLAFRLSQNETKNNAIIKVIYVVIIAALLLTIYRSIFDENIVEDNIETIEKEKQSEEDAIKELEGIEIDE